MLLLLINDLHHAIYRSHFVLKWSHMTQTSVLEITRADARLNGQPITRGMRSLPREVTSVWRVWHKPWGPKPLAGNGWQRGNV